MTDSKPKTSVTIDSYDVALLMSQTRKLAADYRKQTGQALPVTEELARFDAINLLGLSKIRPTEGIDARDPESANLSKEQSHLYLIKGRVIFKGGKARQKLGKLSLGAKWTSLLMVIYDAEYQPTQIHKIDRKVIEKVMHELPTDKRGSMTVARYKAIGELVWDAVGLESTQTESKPTLTNPAKMDKGLD